MTTLAVLLFLFMLFWFTLRVLGIILAILLVIIFAAIFGGLS